MKFKRKTKSAGEPGAVGMPTRYETSAPSVQTALDIFPGEWSSELPGEFARCRAGDIPLFQDTRIAWLLEQMGSIEGMNVLELGPLEACHSYMLDRAGARRVVSIEANRRAFLKCLIVKEVLGLPTCEFLCGDFMEYLRESEEQFDLIVASGVLYHMIEPAELLHRAASRTDNLFLWTHFYDQECLDRNGTSRGFFRRAGSRSTRASRINCIASTISTRPGAGFAEALRPAPTG